MDKTWRKTCRDGSFVEGVRQSGEHLHYETSGGSDVPVHWRDERTGAGFSLRRQPIQNWIEGERPVAAKKALGRNRADVRKGSDEGITDIQKKRDESERRVSDLEMVIERLSGVRGGVSQDEIAAMKKEIEQAVEEQRREFEGAADDVHKQEDTLEERVDALSEGVTDKEADAKDAHGAAKALKTDFIKHHLSQLEQESKDEAGDYKEQKKGLEATIKEVSKQMKEQERRAKKTPRFSI